MTRDHFHEGMSELLYIGYDPGVGPTPIPCSVSENGPFENFLHGLLKLIFHTSQHNGPNRTAVFPQETIPDLLQMSPDRLILRNRCNSQSIILSENTYS